MEKKNDKKIRAILFDIDDTLFPSGEFASLARRNAMRAMIAAGMRATEKQALAAHMQILEKYGSNYSRHFDLLAKKFPCQNPLRAIAAGIAAYHGTKTSIYPFPHSRAMLLRLQHAGYLLCVATEGKALKQWDKLIRLGLDPFFAHVFITAKKSPSFYRSCARKLRLPSHECLMVGDHPRKDFLYAKKAGMLALLVVKGKPMQKSASKEMLGRLSSLLL
ncbi:HAD hydrolase-like protein [Candidatus Micrarchaeota archaeon]|nr:HAD hydrolase-like protein [Candidatus Micrarchaeota archaeon]